MDFPQSCGIASRSSSGGRIYPHIVGAETPADLITDMFAGLQRCSPTTSELCCLVVSFFMVLKLFDYMSLFFFHVSLTGETGFFISKMELVHHTFLDTLMEVVDPAVDNL